MTKLLKLREALASMFSLLFIEIGLFGIIHCFMIQKSNFWEVVLFTGLFIGGLDWRFNQHKVRAEITIRKVTEQDPEMEFTKHE